MPQATLRLESPHAKTVMRSLAPEVGREIPRTRVEIEADAEAVILRIDAADVSALRAALNSYLRWIKISEEIGNIAGDKDG